MGDHELQMEMIFIPAKNGYIKVFVYGFNHLGTWGNAVAVYNGESVSAKGFNKKRTVVHSLAKLHRSLLKKRREN
ncbi:MULTISPECIES: hypothetical protein [unclassified Bacillus (in: firmicutes)]|uniref:hypothetical protein n=1 Tax=unclassified Bacillus (in: firmicutes) TaxID=185979 RepID=UPI001BE823CC|nr:MULTISPECIES: hypothetical protein [unclassified Bacillus (in: firmicutes)]MBT2637331.1 hypothetical protein [Bacillus sp. ISL-39]MBT2660404.1 hypothetical protein [Bacillus sp. ISL-45]